MSAKSRQGHPDLIVSNPGLPSFDGLSALALASSKAPKTPFVFGSGNLSAEKKLEALGRGAAGCISRSVAWLDLSRLSEPVPKTPTPVNPTPNNPSAPLLPSGDQGHKGGFAPPYSKRSGVRQSLDRPSQYAAPYPRSSGFPIGSWSEDAEELGVCAHPTNHATMDKAQTALGPMLLKQSGRLNREC